jgi:hypothetical protein
VLGAPCLRVVCANVGFHGSRNLRTSRRPTTTDNNHPKKERAKLISQRGSYFFYTGDYLLSHTRSGAE